MNITLLENHWYDATFSPSARFGGEDEGAEYVEQEMEPVRESRDGSRGRLVTALVPVFVVAGVAAGVAVARRIRARNAERAAELRQIEVDAIEYANDIAE